MTDSVIKHTTKKQKQDGDYDDNTDDDDRSNNNNITRINACGRKYELKCSPYNL
jgi:hypothetical protein